MATLFAPFKCLSSDIVTIALCQILQKIWNLHADIFLKLTHFFVKLDVTGLELRKYRRLFLLAIVTYFI